MTTKYIVVNEIGETKFESSINRKLREGYTLVGGVSMIIIEGGTTYVYHYAQAMILNK